MPPWGSPFSRSTKVRVLWRTNSAHLRMRRGQNSKEIPLSCALSVSITRSPLCHSEWKLLRVLEQQIAIPGDDHDELKKGFVLSADLGITLNQILPNKHQAADVASLAHSADAAIITEKYGSHAASGDMSNSKSKKPDLSKALWLMNTQYISSMTLPEHLGRSEKDWAKVRQNIGNENIFGANPRKSQLASINRSFDAAIGTPIHGKHPRLSATKILPVLPDFFRCEQSNVRFTFDEDPRTKTTRRSTLVLAESKIPWRNRTRPLAYTPKLE